MYRDPKADELLATIQALKAKNRELVERNEHLDFCIAEMTTIPAEMTTLPPDVMHALTPSQIRVLAALVEARGRMMTREGLLAAAYHDRAFADWPEIKIIDVYICKIRKTLEQIGSGIEVRTLWGRGFRAIVPEEALC
jgi:two-component system cell cycle response regulator CtrA